jgi:hypothetical protein
MGFPQAEYPASKLIKSAAFDKYRLHKGTGDMWANTWADDGEIYAASGDIPGSVLNFWKVTGEPHFFALNIAMINLMPVDAEFASRLPDTHKHNNMKPAGVIFVNGRLYMTVSSMNYGEKEHYYRQRYPNCWIVTSDDYGVTWDKSATPYDFFSGALCGPTFVQYGKNYAGAHDNYVYACFPCGYNGTAYWENADCLLMGRVPADKILERGEWEFYTGNNDWDKWDKDDKNAKPIFEYPNMTGQNFIQYNEGIGRYIMGNYSFMSEDGEPRPYHAGEFTGGNTKYPSQLTLYESPNPWGPWACFHTDNNWGMYGGYQLSFPAKWISGDGLIMHMVSSGSFDDYNFTVQKITLEL